MKKFLLGLATIVTGLTVAFAQSPQSIESRLQGKNAQEKAQIKSKEIAKNTFEEYTQDGLRIQIENVREIEGGIELFARAWKGTKKIGFGDGTVETERFKIYNPPILVPDPSGDVRREWTDRGGLTHEQRFREDPVQAIQKVIAHNISLVGTGSEKIIPGKIGNTTSTFYPDPNVETTTVDGVVYYLTDNQTWATVHDAATGAGVDDSATAAELFYLDDGTTNNTWRFLQRSAFLFNTASIPDTDTVSSATLSFFGTSKGDTLGSSPVLNIYSANPASNTAIATGDYNDFGTTAFATGIAYASYSTSAYNDLPFNASGRSAISLTSVSKFGARFEADANNTPPSTVNNGLHDSSFVAANFADQAGTTNDPKLVVVHAAAATKKLPVMIL